MVVAFNIVADAQRWYKSSEYSAIRPYVSAWLSHAGFIVEGIAQWPLKFRLSLGCPSRTPGP